MDHRALLFDKNLLPIPVSMYPDYSMPMESSNFQSKFWQGFYVFVIDSQTGFKLKGTVRHSNDTEHYSYAIQGSRSFYIGNILYTVTLINLIKMNDIKTLMRSTILK